jgi:dihydropteroate synthase
MEILQVRLKRDIKKIMQAIGVDPYGIKIMLPKATSCLIKVNGVSSMVANILKQEMLSLGADAAVARGALTASAKKSDCLLIGNLAQLNELKQKLKLQPFGLNKLAEELSLDLENYQRDNHILELGKYSLNLSGRTHIMGIMNLTPDSFSGDGLCSKIPVGRRQYELTRILEFAERLINDGADILDIGGESSRPGADVISAKEETKRIIPVIKLLSKRIKIPISVDTCKPQVAEQALDCGATIVNDITGLRNKELRKIVSKHKAAVVIMHMRGNPRTMQLNPHYQWPVEEIIQFLRKSICLAQDDGIDIRKTIVDPGIGFGKSLAHNLQILNRLADFRILGRPILVGTSRKSFLGKLLSLQPQDRIFGTIASCVVAAKNAANIVRVHDVKEVRQALMVLDRIGKVDTYAYS